MVVYYIATLLIAFYFAPIAIGQTPATGWFFGSEGMQNATIIAQSKIPCTARIGHYSFAVGSTPTNQLVYMPAGEFPLIFSCGTVVSEYGIRASIFMNGVMYNKTWSGFGFTSPINNTCSSPWTSIQNSSFALAGGYQNEMTVWPCPVEVSTGPNLRIVLKFTNKSVTARKVTILVAADNLVPVGSFGPFSFSFGILYAPVMMYTIYVEPGIYEFQALVWDSAGKQYFVGSISLDDVLISKTGDLGWTGLYEDGSVRGPFNPAGSCSPSVGGPGPLNQIVAIVGSSPQYIWTDSNCLSDVNYYEYARFRYTLDVKPRVNATLFRKVDFNFGADDLFAMRIDAGAPVIASPRDSTSYFSNYFHSTPTKYSLYMLPGKYTLKFTVVNYYNGGVSSQAHLRGVISIDNTIIDVTKGSSDKWKDSNGNTAISCGLYSEDLLTEVELPFTNTGIEYIGIGNCLLSGGTYDLFYTLIVPKEGHGFTTTVGAPQNSRSRISASVPIGILSRVRDSRLAILLLAFGVALIIAITVAFLCWRTCAKSGAKKSSHSKTETVFDTSTTTSSGMTSFSDETHTTNSTQRTEIGSDYGAILSIPAYLQFKEGQDFRADKKINNKGSADVMLGTAFNHKLKQFGSQVVVKRVTNGTAMSESQKGIFLQEVSITSYLQNCRNIVRILGYSETPASIVLKMYSRGSISAWLKANAKSHPKSRIFSFLQDIASGISAMHTAGLIHCDIKSDNILVDQDSQTGAEYCVLCDFGITQVADQKILKVQAYVVANRQGFSL
eukprot:Partr_v1_DN28786_c0_g2_i8_m62977